MTVISHYQTMRAFFAVPGAPIAPDGFPTFPGPVLSGDVSNAPTKLRSGGFAASFTATSAGGHVWTPAQIGPIGPLIAGAVPALDALFPLTATINGGASGPNAFAWYLCQRTDPVRYPSIYVPGGIPTANAPQMFTVKHPDNAHSGSVVISVNAAEVLKLFPNSGGTPPTDAASLLTLCMGCTLYVTRLSDNAWQAADLFAHY